MAVQRSCDRCRFYRQNPDGSPAVFRYTLERQVPRPDRKLREGRTNSVRFTRKSCGGIDLCNPCWDDVAGTKVRDPERPCDSCKMRKLGPDGLTTVRRYTLGRQVRRPDGRPKAGRTSGVGHIRKSRGGISLCGECWERIGKPKTRPELRGKTGPRQYRGRVTGTMSA